MTWFKFLLCLAGLYVVYYVFVMLIDIARGKKNAADEGWINELYFEGVFVPERVGHEEADEAENPSDNLRTIGNLLLLRRSLGNVDD